MKKFFTLILSILIVCLPLTACDNKEDNSGLVTVRVNEVTDSIFYAPFYVAIDGGFFEEQGLKIELTNGAGSDVSMTALLSKNADIALLGPETTVYIARQNKKDAPKMFAQLTKRDGCFLIGRNPEPDFSWENLRNKEVIIGRQGGLPAMTFEYVVNKMGMENVTDLTLRKDIQFGLMAPTFDGGAGDYVTLFEPTASEFVKMGKGHIVASVGEKSGEVPYTGFAALESYLTNNKKVVKKFVIALKNAMDFVMTENALKVAEVLKKHFTTTEISSIEASLINYKQNDTWKQDLTLTEDSFNNLIKIINNAGEVTDGVTYNKVVNTSIVKECLAK